MTATKVFTGKHGIFSIQIDVEDGDYTLASEQYESIMDEAVAWQSVCELQKRAKALRGPQVSKEFSKGRTRPGIRKSMKNLEYSSFEEYIDLCEYHINNAIKLRSNLIDKNSEISSYIIGLEYNMYDQIYEGLEHFEINWKMIHSIDKLIVSLRSAITAIRSLNASIEKDTKKRISKIEKSKHRDKKHGRRVKKVPDRAYKLNRSIERANKKANQCAFV